MGILIYFCKITNMQAFTIDANQLQNLIAKINNQHGHRDITLDHAQNSGDHSVLNVAQSSMDNRYGSNNVKMGEFTNDGNYAVTNIGLQNLVTVNNDNGQRNIELDHAQNSMSNRGGSANIDMGEFSNDVDHAVTNIGL